MSATNDEYEQTMCLIKECHVFKIPPRSTIEGYKAEGWSNNHIWTGRLRVIAKGMNCEVRLEDTKTGKIFASCPVNTTNDGVPAIEPAVDSSRYFVLRIENKEQKKHAFIGIGFSERTDAFEFNVALQDHQKFVDRIHDKEMGVVEQEQELNLGLDQGGEIEVNFKLKTKTGKIKEPSTISSSNDSKPNPVDQDISQVNVANFLPPPPSSNTNSRRRKGQSGNSPSAGFEF